MEKRQIIKVALSIILPPVLVIALFASAIGAVIIPATEDALMQKKRDMIQAIVMSATSIIDKHARMEKEGRVSLKESQEAALSEMRVLRYGPGNKDYLWIIDLQPVMIMHPYFPELEGKSLENYADKNGKFFFADAANIAKSKGEGYVDYIWPRHENIGDEVPKLSYIRLFKPWRWVVGSGVYLDDVHKEIREVTRRLVLISSLIGLVVLLLLLFMIRKSWKNDDLRRIAEKELVHSRERYQALAHASREMLFLTLSGIVAGANKKACEVLGMNEDEIISRSFSEFVKEPDVLERLNMIGEEGLLSSEVFLEGKNGPQKVVLSAEHVIVHDSEAIMYAGYLMQSSNETDEIPLTPEALSKIGIGIVILDSLSNGKIVKANKVTSDLLGMESETQLAGEFFSRFFEKDDADRFSMQLRTTGKVENMSLKTKVTVTVTVTVKQEIPPNSMTYIRVWAAVPEDNRVTKGQAVVFITDDTAIQLENKVRKSLLDEFLFPGKKMCTELKMFTEFDSSESIQEETSLKDTFLRTRIILEQSVKTGVNSEEVTTTASGSIDKIFRAAVHKAISIAGPPPCRFALLTFGSIGRSEPTLNPDQDTAIIYEDSKIAECQNYNSIIEYDTSATGCDMSKSDIKPDIGHDMSDIKCEKSEKEQYIENKDVNRNVLERTEYFKHFGKLVTSICEHAGIPPCNAGNHAGNPLWCMCEEEWHKQFSRWIYLSEPEDLIRVNIFFDFRVVAGDENIADNLRRHIFNEVEKRPLFLVNLSQDTLGYKTPSDIFGRIRPDSNTGNYINLKGTMLHYVNFVRIYSLKHGIIETNTIKRLRTLTEKRILPPDTGKDTIDAWKYLLSLRLKNQTEAMEMNFPQENVLILNNLGSWEETMLKKATGHVSVLQKRLMLDLVRAGF